MNLVHLSVSEGGKLAPLIISHGLPDNTGIMNPSILTDDDGDLLVNIRVVNYTLYTCENDKRFPSPWGPLTYLHPEKDQHLRTTNYLCRLDDQLKVVNTAQIDMMNLHTPIWEFIGLEDVRLTRWDGDLYAVGVRRDTTPTGHGRMEYSKLNLNKKDWKVTETYRVRIPAPINEETSYCEKNWMPVLDKPYHFVKWAMPTEVVWANPNEPECKQVIVKETKPAPLDQRGGSQVVRWGDLYIAVTHEVKLWRNYLNQKDSVYRHRMIIWDSDFNLKGLSKEMSFFDTPIEFCTGATVRNNNLLLSFGVQDNTAFVLEVPRHIVNGIITEAITSGH